MRRFLVICFVLVVFVVGAFSFYLFPRLQILNGHAAKTLCSCVFVGGIDEERAKKEDIGFFPVTLGSQWVDYEKKEVVADFFGFKPKRARFREGLGCAIYNELPVSQESLVLIDVEESYTGVDALQSERALTAHSDAQIQAVERAMEWAFAEEDPENPTKITRATLVFHMGELVAERYAPGFDSNSRLLGWSMTKTITALLYGILERQGRLSLDDPAPIPAWEGTDKEGITIRHLLNMSSGLAWSENYADRSSVTVMLYESDAMGVMAASASKEFEPGEAWYYSSGTSNILAALLSSYFEDQKTYQRFPYEALFAPLGMKSMCMETDAAGYFVGSSYSWATARDWAKLGLLMLNQGVFEGDTLVNPSWIEFMREPVPASDGLYGGQLWLNAGGKMSATPDDAFSARGFHGQRVQVIPSQDLVLVRLGETYFEPNFDFDEWNQRVISALGEL
ncbi:MAG: serine hydrolase [Bacteroidota bacterium]